MEIQPLTVVYSVNYSAAALLSIIMPDKLRRPLETKLYSTVKCLLQGLIFSPEALGPHWATEIGVCSP